MGKPTQKVKSFSFIQNGSDSQGGKEGPYGTAMENPRIKPLTEAQFKAQREKKTSSKFFWWMFGISIGLIAASSCLFFWHNVSWFIWSGSIDSGLLASLGTFVGGILGTLITALSVYMLVKTLHTQVDANANMEDTNKKMIELNKQQLFDNKFQVLYAQYNDAVSAYDGSSKSGKQNLEAATWDLLTKHPFNNNLVYSLRIKAAVKVFEEFYAKNRASCSVHFRVLYQLMRFIDRGDIEENDRVIYVKSVRGQLTDGEMALLRYNCLTPNGKAMQQYVNHFNLLKHVPLMNLLEFKQWADKVPDKHKRAALDTTFITLRKMMKELNGNDEPTESNYDVSSRFLIKIEFEQGHRCMIFRLEENKKAKSGGPVKHPYAESALKAIGNKELPSLFYAFLYETFIVSNFGRYENVQNCVHAPIEVENTTNNFIFEIMVKGPNRLVLSQSQYTPSTRNNDG